MRYHSHHTQTIKVRIQIIWACAWCDPETYQPLKRGQAYTHGICTFHKVQVLKKSEQLFAKRKIN